MFQFRANASDLCFSVAALGKPRTFKDNVLSEFSGAANARRQDQLTFSAARW
jgi:hypothetical protein